MKIVKILCDRCGAEIEGMPYAFNMVRLNRENEEVAEMERIKKDFCRVCALNVRQDIVDALMPMVWAVMPEQKPKEPEPEETPEPEPEPEPEPVATQTTETTETTDPATQTTEATHKPPRKRWITKDDAEEITRRYKAGEDMLKIADDLNLMRPQVSRFIAAGKLGQERYKNKTVPSKGGAPIPTCELGRSVGGEMSDWR